ncbi:nuclear transport factor 2 family protein [Bacillus sp. Xin]|uniref:nuclear transport factor 2 family protein n=1 Tax=unclassified Bacillus (in: firmicutes) TaxID=185979 RepID=UPI0015726BB1|nr:MULTISPECIES: nuclear transport factor 2 family protein [unclassified Bacillus (in: firmicutes)]MBC6973915.1 nuclear transport factor 2 family protein [Bacillus sp. Xin]NSW39310.1 nuclear transport factor 2 family protein [Bacillus sp. Xin1]
MISEEIKEIIENYVKAYNSFDVKGMIKLLHNDILFRNLSNDELNMEIRGIQGFRELAEKSSKILSSRHLKIIDYSVIDNKVEVQIDYEGILAIDVPNGLKMGNKMKLKGKSVFEIKEGKILLIEDYS